MIITLQQKFFGHHGWYEEEQSQGHWFEVKVRVRVTDMSPSNSNSENLSNTFNYEVIHQIIDKRMKSSRKLLESVAQDIYADLKLIDSHMPAEITIVKLNPFAMPDVDFVSIQIGDAIN